MTETAGLADVVLPAACFAEKDGTFTSIDRRIQILRKAVEPPGQAMPDWKILSMLASRMGYAMGYESPMQIMEEIARLVPIYNGVDYGRLHDDGLYWPCRGGEGTRRLEPDRKPRLAIVDYTPPSERVYYRRTNGMAQRSSISMIKEVRGQYGD